MKGFGETTIHKALFAWFFSAGFLTLWSGKVQLPDLVFLALAALSAIHYGKALIPRRIGLLDGAILLYLLANALSAWQSGAASAWLEVAGRAYLAAVFFLIRFLVRRAPAGALRQAMRGLWAMALVVSVCGIAAWAAWVLGFPNQLVQVYEGYPYLGTVGRVAGFAPSGALFFSLILPAVLMLAIRSPESRESRPWLLLTLIAAALTFSKSLVLLLAGLLMIAAMRFRWPKWLGWAVAAGGFAVFQLGAHVVVYRSADDAILQTHFTTREPLAVTDGLQLLPTAYYALKIAAWEVGARNPWLGVGPGEFNRQLPALKTEGKYPDHLPGYDPHSTWMGAFAETGLAGLFALVLLTVLYIRTLLPHWPAIRQDAILPALLLFLLITLLESPSMDVMNFRHLWGVMALLSGAAEARREAARTP